MSINTFDEGLVNQVVNDIANLKKQVYEMRANQASTLKYGDITINGETNQITLGVNVILDESGYMALKDNGGDEIVRFNSTGIIVQTTGTNLNEYIFFKKSGSNVGKILFRRYTPVSDEVSDMILRVLHGSASNRVTYNTLDIYSNDGLTRDVFFQMDSAYSGGSFQTAAINFGKQGATASFSVVIDDTSGRGYMRIPSRASDPGSAPVASIYYNTSSGKFRGKDVSGWVDLA